MSNKTIVVLATLDTKGREADYLRRQIEQLGHTAVVLDTGVIGAPGTRADITREAVAAAGGSALSVLLARPDREVIIMHAFKPFPQFSAEGQIPIRVVCP